MGGISRHGTGLARLPTHPRLGHVLLCALAAGGADGAALRVACACTVVELLLPLLAVPQLGSCASSGCARWGPVQLGTPRVRPSHRAPSHRLGGPRERPAKVADCFAIHH